MTTWADRSEIPAAYLNPALLAVLASAAAYGYARETGHPMSWPLIFIVCPLVLHRPTRQALPTSTRTHLSTWVTRNPLIRAGFPARAESLTSFVREGLRFGLHHGLLFFENGALRGTQVRVSDTETQSLLRAAMLVGRWLGKTDQPSTTFALFGVAL